MKNRQSLASLLIVSAVIIAPLALSPATGADQSFRQRAGDSKATVRSLTADVEAEIRFGRDVAARIVGRHGLYASEPVTRYVNLIGQAVAMHASRPELRYRFAVLDTNTVNAYAAPGGYIFVTRGALSSMRDEAELAGVLAHEIAHVTQKHIVKELNIRGQDDATEAGIAHFLGGTSDPTRVAFSQAVDKAMDLLFESGLKKADELEADRVGALILANTGYGPKALPRYLERISDGRETTRLLHATHPPFSERLAKLNELIRSEGLDAMSAGSAQKRFAANMRTMK